MEVILEHYEPASWTIPEDFMTRSHFDRVVMTRLDWTSSPGYPYIFMATNNRQFFGFDGFAVDPVRADVVWHLVLDHIENECADPIRIFIKGEPVKKSKLLKGRARLISSVSVVDQIIDHMLFDAMNDALLDNYLSIPSKVGWSPHGGGWKTIPGEIWLAADKSSWDWTVMPWLLSGCLEIRARLCRTSGEKFEKWVSLASMRYRLLFDGPLMVNSHGLIFKQKHPGVIKSGCVNTIADNSLMQFYLHVRVSQLLRLDVGSIFIMGDDTLQRLHPADVKAYIGLLEQFCIVKEYSYTNDFAGFRFRGRRVEPLYRGKHAYQLLHLNDDFLDEMSSSYQLLYHRSSCREWIRAFFSHLGAKLLDSDYLDAIFDGED